ncbi:hypothetical protein KKA14_06765, partial [bacterium]|nr:hypothetical protein [bacterium]
MTKAALEAYRLLRQSGVLQAESSRDEREEVITLLRHYGFALYEAIIPEQHKSQIYESGGLFVYSLDYEIINIPWELLYDGSSFLALTQGVIRINNSSVKLSSMPPDSEKHSLNISLNSYTPTRFLPSGNRFISVVEELISENIGKSSLVDYTINGNASKKTILENLSNNPDVFFFSGYDGANGWILQDTSDENDTSWFQRDLTPALKKAVEKGLKIAILQTSSFLEESDLSKSDPLTKYFNLGIPYIISVHGRVSRHRVKQYFQTFLLSLMREQNTLRAHRQAINNIQSNLPLSWDWSWIQLHINKNLLEIPTESPLASYKFDQDLKKTEKASGFNSSSILNHRRFPGNFEILSQLTNKLLKSSFDEVIHLQTREGYFLEEYFQEFLRRLMPDHTFSLSVLYYQRWGFKKDQQERLPSSKYAKLFS